jgi:hypothetical protein
MPSLLRLKRRHASINGLTDFSVLGIKIVVII